jgi:hypothetical protein
MITNCIQLDFNKENDLKVPSVQYDSGSRFVKIKLQRNKSPFEIDGYRVTVVANKVDGTEIMNDCTILDGVNGVVQFEITEQFNAVEGVVDCQLKLFKGETLLTSMPFSINVVKSVSTKEIVSSNELKTLVNALGEVQDIDNRFAQTNAQLSSVVRTRDVSDIANKPMILNIRDLVIDGRLPINNANNNSDLCFLCDDLQEGTYSVFSKIYGNSYYNNSGNISVNFLGADKSTVVSNIGYIAFRELNVEFENKTVLNVNNEAKFLKLTLPPMSNINIVELSVYRGDVEKPDHDVDSGVGEGGELTEQSTYKLLIQNNSIIYPKITVDTVSHLSNIVAPLNSMLICANYYDGDSCEHKRVVQQMNDGSGIALANGYFANLVCDNGVDCQLFGLRSSSTKDESIQSIRNWVAYVNNTKGKYFAPRTPKDGGWYPVYEPFLVKKSFKGIGSSMPTFMYVASEVGKVISETELSHSGTYNFNVDAVIGVKQINYGDTDSRFEFENFKILCTSADDDTSPSQSYGLYVPELNSAKFNNITVVRPNEAGFKLSEVWMSSLTLLNTFASRKNGFMLGGDGVLTSLTVKNCYAHGYKHVGFNVGQAMYSTFMDLGSDSCRNAEHGIAYQFGSCYGTNLQNIGTESCDVAYSIYVGDFYGSISGVYTKSCRASKAFFEAYTKSNLTISGVYHHGGYDRFEDSDTKTYVIRDGNTRLELNVEEVSWRASNGKKLIPDWGKYAKNAVINSLRSKSSEWDNSYLTNYDIAPIQYADGSHVVHYQNGWCHQYLTITESDNTNEYGVHEYSKDFVFPATTVYITYQLHNVLDGEQKIIYSGLYNNKCLIRLSKNLGEGKITAVVFSRKQIIA